MRPGARASAAIEILDDIGHYHRPAFEAMRDWGRAHRFAGSSDRAAISNLVNAALRRRQSISWFMGEDTARALVIGALHLVWQWPVDDVDTLADGAQFSPFPLSPLERQGLSSANCLNNAPQWVRGDYPEWLAGELLDSFGERCVQEGAGLSGRAPLDLRVNTLKTNRQSLLVGLAKFDVVPTDFSEVGLRVDLPEGWSRPPNIERQTLHGRGRFEIQDEGSQIAACMSGARPGIQLIDYCAGAGGKTLAMAAQMQNKGQIYAHDANADRLRPIFERLRRAGVRNVQVTSDESDLKNLFGKADVVLVDAPCSGSGTWRRRPEAKWRLGQKALESRLGEQAAILTQAARYVRPGGHLVYVTCSVVARENTGQVDEFIADHPTFKLLPWKVAWRECFSSDPPNSADGSEQTLLLTPASHRTDGFFIAILQQGDNG